MNQNNNFLFETLINSKITDSLLINLTWSPGKKKTSEDPPPPPPLEIASFWAPLPSEFPLPSVGSMDFLCNYILRYPESFTGTKISTS